MTSYNTATGRREFIAISTPQEVSMGQDVHKKLLTEYHLCEDRNKVARVNRVGARVAQVSDRQDFEYHFFLIEKDEMNAFTVPGGNVYCFTGLLDRLTSDDQLAAVLGHEVGHCAARHTVKKFQAAVSYSIIGELIFTALGVQEQMRKITSMGANAIMNLVFSAYGRQDEFEADRLGLKYMHLAGYNMEGMVQTFEILKQQSKGPEPPALLRTHPYLDDRIEQVRREMEKIRMK